MQLAADNPGHNGRPPSWPGYAGKGNSLLLLCCHDLWWQCSAVGIGCGDQSHLCSVVGISCGDQSHLCSVVGISCGEPEPCRD